MNIACCTDHNYIMPTGVMMTSVCMNHPHTHVTFYIICDKNVTEQDKLDLKTIVSKHQHDVEFIPAPQITDETKCFTIGKEGQPSHITLASYYRLFLAELLPLEVEKIIYLDSDIIVRHSLLEMYNTTISEVAVAAVTDSEEGLIYKYNNLRYEQELGHFNAGVLLINVKYWREHQLLKEFIAFATKYPERIKLHDQDILNYVLRLRKKVLSLKYNVQSGFFLKKLSISWKYESELKEAIEDPYILHFCDKPWKEGCEVPYKEEFFYYQRNTIWKNCPLIPISLKVKIKKLAKKILCTVGLLSHKPSNIYIDI